MPTDKEIRVSGVSQSVRLHQAIRCDVSNLYGGIHKANDNPIDSLTLKRGDRGIWLCVAKRYNTDTGTREVIFGHGSDFVEAIVSANAMIAAGKWVTDKPWSGRS